MRIGNAIKAVFGTIKQRVVSYWREIGGYTATFSPYNGQIYANDTCRACIRKLAEDTSKANAKVEGEDAELEYILNVRPNLFMSGKDYLYKCRTLYEIHNTLFVFINRDQRGDPAGYYPIPDCQSEAVEADGELYIRFWLPAGEELVVSWMDLIVLRKDYNSSDIYGDANTAIGTSLDLLGTTNQGIANAIKSTANLRGLLKSTKNMLSNDDVKAAQKRFVDAYAGMENKSGIAMLDSTQTYTPLNVEPVIANYRHVESLRDNIFRYYGMSEKAVKNELTGDEAEAFYEGAIEPFLLALSLETTYKSYHNRRRRTANEITYESNRMQFMTIAQKLALVAMVNRKAMTPNEWRKVLNMAPIKGGDDLQSWQNPKDTTPTKTEGSDENAESGK